MNESVLSNTQREVMKWLKHGWTARQAHGKVVEVNGRKLCTVGTMLVLERHGLVNYDAPTNCWKASEKGRAQHED